jgi:hypothetical protein
MKLRVVRGVIACLFQTAALGFLLLALGAIIGRSFSQWGTFSLSALVVITAQVCQQLRPPALRSEALSWGPVVDRPFARLSTIRERLGWGLKNPEYFRRALQPMLLELIDDKLRRTHGLDLHRDPAAARAMTGEPVWQLVTEEVTVTPTTADIDLVLRTVEAL